MDPLFSDRTPGHRPRQSTCKDRRVTAARGLALGLVFGLMNVMSPTLSGAVIEYQYSGTITWADPSTGIAAGSPFSGTFAYDTSITQPAISIEGSNQYFSGSSGGAFPGGGANGSGLSLAVDGHSMYSTQAGLQVGVSEIEYAGQYGYQSSPQTHVTVSNGNLSDPSLAVSLNFGNSTSAVLHSLAIPSAINLADFNQAQLTVDDNSAVGKPLYTGTIDLLSPAPVPEPSFVSVLGVVAAGWVARKKGRRSDNAVASGC